MEVKEGSMGFEQFKRSVRTCCDCIRHKMDKPGNTRVLVAWVKMASIPSQIAWFGRGVDIGDGPVVSNRPLWNSPLR